MEIILDFNLAPDSIREFVVSLRMVKKYVKKNYHLHSETTRKEIFRAVDYAEQLLRQISQELKLRS